LFEKNPIIRWRKYNNNYFLEADQCTECNKIYYPKGYLCNCNNKNFKKITLSGKGALLSFTEITTPPSAFQKSTPYCIGIIELEEGVKITGQIADTKLKDLNVGMPVQACFRKLYECDQDGTINYGIKFIPRLFVATK